MTDTAAPPISRMGAHRRIKSINHRQRNSLADTRMRPVSKLLSRSPSSQPSGDESLSFIFCKDQSAHRYLLTQPGLDQFRELRQMASGDERRHLELSFDELLDISYLSCPLRYPQLKRWTLNTITHLIRPGTNFLRHIPTETFERLLDVAVSARHQPLSEHVARRWCSRILNGELPPARALNAAQRHGILWFRAMAHYAQLCHVGPATITAHSDVGYSGAHMQLAEQQRRHSDAGHYSLYTLGNELFKEAPTLHTSEKCGSHSVCISTWRARWVATVTITRGYPAFDVLRRLWDIEKRMEADPVLQRALTAGCKAQGLAYLRVLQNQIAKDLPHHFGLC